MVKNVAPVQSTTYVLQAVYNQIYFELGTDIAVTHKSGVYGGTGVAWQVTNAGAISASGTSAQHHSGVSLKGSSNSLTNDASGKITVSGYGSGVYLGGPGTVDNAGVLAGYGAYVSAVSAEAAITATNTGTIKVATAIHSVAVNLKAGGSFTNKASGVVQDFGSYVGGVAMAAAGTVTNYGSITATTDASGHGNAVDLTAGGALVNKLGGKISASGYRQAGVYMASGGTTTNYGQITDTTGYTYTTGRANAVELELGGTFLNKATGSVSVIGAYVAAVSLHSATSTLTNYASASISASGAHGSGVFANAAATVTNSGSISFKNTSGLTNGAGVNLTAGGDFKNKSGGTVYGYGSHVSAVYPKGAATAENYASITGVASSAGRLSGVDLESSSSVFHNEATGTVGVTGLYTAGVSAKAAAEIYNYGSITATGIHSNAVYLAAGGTLTNTKIISGSATVGLSGVSIAEGANILNKANASISGHIAGVDNAGKYFLAAGTGSTLTLTNYTGASITGYTGVFANSATAKVTNAGTVSGTALYTFTSAQNTARFGDGVYLGQADDSLNNQTGGQVTGVRYGVYAAGADASVTNAGSIGGATTAIQFEGAGSNQLTLKTGSSLTGNVVGSTASGATNALMLQGSGSAGNAISNFTTLDVTSGADWTLSGGSTIGSATIEGSLTTNLVSSFTLNAGSTLDLNSGGSDAVAFNGGATLEVTNLFTGEISGASSNDKVNVTNLTGGTITGQLVDGAFTVVTVDGMVNGSSFEQQLKFAGTTFGTFTAAPDAVSGTDIEVPCFARGTRIKTLRGEIAVEHLQVGDRVATASGGSRPIVWLGHRDIDCRRHADPKAVQPIRVAANAFASNAPHRDLWLSPGHSVAIDDVLIPIGFLLNGHSIERVAADAIEYWHVELDAHDILLAEGLAAELYLDCGNRGDFANGGAFVSAHPDFLPKHARATCLPLALEGPTIAKTKQALLDRLSEHGVEASRDADAHILADGRRVAPILVRQDRLAFVIPKGCEFVVLSSRAFTPAYSEAGSNDQRELGLCVSRLSVDGDNRALECDARGWLEAEYEEGRVARRWTNGAAELSPRAQVVVVDLASRPTYLVKKLGSG